MNTETKISIASPELYNSFIINDAGVSSLLSTDDVMSGVPLGHEGEMFITSSIVCEEIDEELDQETDESTQVTIIISDSCAADKNSGVSLVPSHTHLDANPSPWNDPVFVRKCLEQCLKLTSPEKSDVCCFLCAETCKSFISLRKHLKESHDLSHGIARLPSFPAQCISETAKEIRKLECKCSAFVCPTCEVTFRHFLKLVQHVLLDHPTRCGDFTLFAEQQQKSHLEKCQRCMVLDKLCRVDYDFFMRVLLECMECCDEECRALLLSWPLPHYAEPCEWCAKEEEGKEHSENSPSTYGAEKEVVCYRIKQEHCDKSSQESATSSECICPLMKCPECPKTVANYADLRKHVRQNSHGTWHDLRLMWEKYKSIKENCPVCPKHSYHTYILCPHCPHLDFESERDAQTHMNSHYNTQDKLHGGCTCPDNFLCLQCNTSYPTPQTLHRHMNQAQHETPENLAAIPAMIQSSMGSRDGCSHCSLQESLSPTRSQEDKCSCRWAECSTCKTSFRRVSGLLDHTLRAKHPMSARDIRKEREKVASSMVTCRRCCIETNKYCALCHQRENFMYTHLRTLHQDCQIMLLRDDCGNVLEEHHTGGSDCQPLARYECSVCHVCHPRVNELLCHVRRQHPRRHFTLTCIDLSEDVRDVKDLAGHQDIMLLSVADKKL